MGFFEKILYDNSYSVLHELFKSCSTAQFHQSEGLQLENVGRLDPFKSLCKVPRLRAAGLTQHEIHSNVDQILSDVRNFMA